MTAQHAAIRQMLIAGGLLLAFTLAGVGLVALTYDNTLQQIEENRRAMLLRQLSEVVPHTAYDNQPQDDVIAAKDPVLLGVNEHLPIYRLRGDGEPVATVVTAVAPDGYSGEIILLVGVDRQGEITGVRVAGHKETPGLGDAIERSRSNWITQFRGETLGDADNDDGESDSEAIAQRWQLRRDGGEFDQISGATITARAVISAIHNALLFQQRHGELLFADADTLEDALAAREEEQRREALEAAEDREDAEGEAAPDAVDDVEPEEPAAPTPEDSDDDSEPSGDPNDTDDA
ncbi:electron transport complex subunit RsxG [Methylonatrum kenyense]|uniref:electron transport complex subunit RsxG n=1 Tax=Methylonatrum kenyense TaxID=455253 RepID=UPI0020C1377B|nr:electron transport complex subunit RsxG [Methylonatrum kenyense]MCK8514836.1 electron transport complex subunit RsxG [Methylonatrum kenyense]